MPVAPHAAVIPGKYYHIGKRIRDTACLYPRTCLLIISAGYTEAINLMNYSAVVIPVTKADKEVDVIDNSYLPANELDRKNWTACKTPLTH
jgi:amidase